MAGREREEQYRVVGVFDDRVTEHYEDYLDTAEVYLDVLQSCPGLREAYILAPDLLH